MKISAAQLRVLKGVRNANNEGRALKAPDGPVRFVLIRLNDRKLVETRPQEGAGYWITDAGRAELAGVEGSKP